MEKIRALVISQIEGASASDDGQHMLLKTDLPDILAFRSEALPDLLTTVLEGIGRTAKLSGMPGNARLALQPDHWDVGVSLDKESVILTFRMPGDTRLSFQVHRDQADGIRQALESIAGAGPKGAPPGSSVQ